MLQDGWDRARENFAAMKRAHVRLTSSNGTLDIRDAWVAVVSENYSLGEKLKVMFDENVPAEKSLCAQFFAEQKSDKLLRCVFLFRKMMTHHSVKLQKVDVWHMFIPGKVLSKYMAIPVPRPDFDVYARLNAGTDTTMLPVYLGRFKHIDHKLDLGWVNTPTQHRGQFVLTAPSGLTPADVCRFLIPYYENLFSQMAAFPITTPLPAPPASQPNKKSSAKKKSSSKP